MCETLLEAVQEVDFAFVTVRKKNQKNTTYVQREDQHTFILVKKYSL